MRLPRKPGSKRGEELSPDDTQEMFAAGQPVVSDDTGEYEAVEVDGIEEEAWEEYEEWDEDPPSEEADEEVVEEEADEADEEAEAEPEEDAPQDSGEENERAGDSMREFREAVAKHLATARIGLAGLYRRAKTGARDLLRKVGETRLPRHEIDGLKVLAGAGIACVVLMVGAGGFLIGKGTGEDLDSARLEGEYAGRKAGAVAGATEGYAAGFKKGRDIAFRKAYAASYRRNYRRAYEAAGMDPPKAKDIEVPKP